jgi:hypothetical protein
MQANVLGRVKNVSLANQKGLHPLFEAIINSIDAIEDAPPPFSGHRIDVCILRDTSLFGQLEAAQQAPAGIRGFEVTDDGVGFNEQNFRAFNEADTQVKAARGGRGVGRFLWLKAFDKVEVDSVYLQDGKLLRRAFDFSLETLEGVGNLRGPVEATDEAGPRTVVRLLGFKEEYESHVPKSAQAIAQQVVEHCLEYFVLGGMPTAAVHDEASEGTTSLQALYEELVQTCERAPAQVGAHTFEVTHFTLGAHRGRGHVITYCADKRAVKSQNIATKIPNLPTALTVPETGATVVYAGYVKSTYLDQHVNQERTGFDTIPADGLPVPPEELSWPQI